MYVVQFIRRDRKPDEEYCYDDETSAYEHMKLFFGDDSDLYERINIVKIINGEETIISYLLF